ncbi:SapC family protein [Alteromonas mediterranea]|uniref:SapC family protein n=1 Tax=Alteromonas mediterranea TaxID=314275 RepID=UPI0011307C8B|nr:SapC family protein [Alteromonas mediterranea]QDG33420.1 SapC family protein [Alteromonas mediterranea]
MPKFETLSADTHSNIAIDESKLATTYSKFHLLNIEIKEAVQAASEFPLFFSKSPDAKYWTISALCGLAPQENVFETQGTWLGHYAPLSLRTLPFVTRIDGESQQQEILVDVESPAISTQGEPLFLASKRPTAYLDTKKKLLEERVNAMQQTAVMLNQLSEMGLIHAVDLIIEYKDNTNQRVGGLATVNEQRLQNLTGEELASLNQKGLLNVLFNMLGSIFQVNRVIRLQNTKFPGRAVNNIKFETSKS